MAVSIKLEETEFMGGVRVRHFDVEVTNYTDGGELIDDKDLGMTRIQNVILTPDEGQVFSTGFDRSENMLVLDILEGEDASLKMTVMGK